MTLDFNGQIRRATARALLLGLAACHTTELQTNAVPRNDMPSAPPSAPAATSGLDSLDLEARFGSYVARDALWAAEQPLFVNRDFDFSVAMLLDGVGAGLAASQRREGNAALAKRLSQLPRIDAVESLADLERRCQSQCGELRLERARLYGLLYGEKTARLQVILEMSGDDGAVLQYRALGAVRATDAYLQANTLSSDFSAGVESLARVLRQPARAPADAAERGQCHLGGQTKARGSVLWQRDGARLLLLDDLGVKAYLACPAEAFSKIDAEALSPASRPGAVHKTCHSYSIDRV